MVESVSRVVLLTAMPNSELSVGVGSMYQPWPSALTSTVTWPGVDWPSQPGVMSATSYVVCSSWAILSSDSPAAFQLAIAAATAAFSSAWVRWVSPAVGLRAATPPDPENKAFGFDGRMVWPPLWPAGIAADAGELSSSVEFAGVLPLLFQVVLVSVVKFSR